MTSNPNFASVFSSKEKLFPLFKCFSIPVASAGNIPQLCLSVLSHLTSHAPCLEAMVAYGSSLLLLLQMHLLVVVKELFMFFWQAVRSSHGQLPSMMEWSTFLNFSFHYKIKQRAAAASLLGKLVGQPMHGPKVAITLARFLPYGLKSIIRDGPGEAVVSALYQATESPELA